MEVTDISVKLPTAEQLSFIDDNLNIRSPTIHWNPTLTLDQTAKLTEIMNSSITDGSFEWHMCCGGRGVMVRKKKECP
jgi:hypothetical protein